MTCMCDLSCDLKSKLHQLEQDAQEAAQQGQTLSLNLGFTEDTIEHDENASDIKEALIQLDPDDLSPKQALEELYRLKKLLNH